MRYRLMDFTVLIKRLILYVLTAGALAPIVFASVWMVDGVTQPDRWSALPWREPLTLLAVFVLALPLIHRLERLLSRIMFRRQHGVRDALVTLGRDLATALDTDDLGRRLAEGLVQRIPALHASLHLYDDQAKRLRPVVHCAIGAERAVPGPALPDVLMLWLQMSGRTLVIEESSAQIAGYPQVQLAVRELERHRGALLVPIVVDGGLAGGILIGEKLSGEVFEGDEIELVEALARETGLALSNVRLYEDLRQQMTALQQTQAQLLQSAKLAAIGELAASVAHELNNPLMVVLGNSGLL
ncbi:MAG: hypothetical protein HYU43_08325, partial [Armatimonadetes bacterium]|nr:hypothetical protein [Armatimonadota bacterium]